LKLQQIKYVLNANYLLPMGKILRVISYSWKYILSFINCYKGFCYCETSLLLYFIIVIIPKTLKSSVELCIERPWQIMR